MASNDVWSREIVFTRGQVARFIQLTGDKNPLHHDDELARAVGMRSANVPGALISGVVLALAAARGSQFTDASIVFKSWCYVGEPAMVRQIRSEVFELSDLSGRLLMRVRLC